MAEPTEVKIYMPCDCGWIDETEDEGGGPDGGHHSSGGGGGHGGGD